MARKSKGTRSDNNNTFHSIISRIQERFPNFILGLTIFVLAALFSFLIFKKDESNLSPAKRIVNFITGNKDAEQPAEDTLRVYTVKEGDHLWKIAEEAYGSGYNAYDIAAANKIEDPYVLEAGQKLTLPKAEAKKPTRGETATQDTQPASPTATTKVTLTSTSYTVKSGDCLWNIAVAAYGDGFMYPRIAQANNIANPDLIYLDTKLTLPGK